MSVSTLLPSDRKLSEVTRHLVVPEGITTSVFPRVYRRLTEAGVAFDRWQQGFGTVCLGCRSNGKYAATVGGVVAPWPRQVGKTFTVGNIVIGACLEFPGLQVVWTSHHLRTTTRTFQSMQKMVHRPGIRHHLMDNRSDGIRTANGEQEIEFANGSKIMFGARARGFGRGFESIDWEVFDEAQILSIEALEDMVPATNAAKHPHGGLVFFLGTPPRPGDDGEAFTTKRRKSLRRNAPDQLYVEISADPDTPDSQLDDPALFATFNPSYPHRTSLEAMQRMRENIPSDDSWRREAMGIWPADGFEQVVAPSVWATLVSTGPADGVAPDAFGVDMSHDRQLSVGACWLADGVAHVEEVFHSSAPAEVLNFLNGAAGYRIPIVIDNVSPAAALVPQLKAARRMVSASSMFDMAKACGMFESRAFTATLSHGDQERITKALEGARRRDIREAGGWGWDRSDKNVQIHPLVAVTLALLGAAKNDRPRRTGERRASVS
ncbi:terminase [Williamsia deligens]|uniref:Terminase n=1 Tax=Williamsia deligens TaxID=321325 RepID=A0ABW3GC02_9NOCA|nr:terminase [Williamsia deligens]MCP2196296.1 hypothetical protein [Williamsia deligens]